MNGFPEYDSLDGVGLAGLVAKGEVSPAQLVDEAIRRIERWNPSLNAVVLRMYDHARRAATAADDVRERGPFHGVPFLLKDLLQTIPGIPTSSGCAFTYGRLYDEEGTLASRWRRAGLIPVAKTSTPELGLLPVTEPERFGPTRNPWDLGRTPGGSSGGSAAAVAARIVPIASGGDGGGSIRIPAACCGLFGLKPSRGRMPMGPYMSEGWAGLGVEHVLTRSVRDSAVAFDATAGIDLGSPYAAPALAGSMRDAAERDPRPLRIAFHCDPAMPGDADADARASVRDAATLLESLGHHVEERRPGHAPRELARAFLTIIAVATAAEIADASRAIGRKAKPKDFEFTTWLAAMIGRGVSGQEHAEAIYTLQAETRRLARHYQDYDVVLTPTLPNAPVKIGELLPSPLERVALEAFVRSDAAGLLRRAGALDLAIDRVFAFVNFTPVANFTGQPSMAVPLYWNGAGLPVGAMFTARYGDEATLFALAGQLERARPWADRRPPLLT